MEYIHWLKEAKNLLHDAKPFLTIAVLPLVEWSNNLSAQMLIIMNQLKID